MFVYMQQCACMCVCVQRKERDKKGVEERQKMLERYSLKS